VATAPEAIMMLARLARKAPKTWTKPKGDGVPGPAAPAKPATGATAGQAVLQTGRPEKRNPLTITGATPAAEAGPRAVSG